MLAGRCHCGAVTYEMPPQTIHAALCHCTDCRRAAGAPMVAWAMVPADQVKIEGATRIYASSEHGRRHFCEVFPGLIDVQSATLDDPGALRPTAHIQVAERISWMATAHELPEFDRYPG